MKEIVAKKLIGVVEAIAALITVVLSVFILNKVDKKDEKNKGP